ncbi:hypothetical protein [Pontibacter sp. G13]|uniref:hypothetical protein n=1 Tax=Pontibacter sp. G13 TaxID=3074898 RepID=UPI00288AC5EF|nr:hypothetical protein [Pontibacter sp. G13]WNJ20480.1 hypothetical protein RJD25_08360 [Pontibacter sp. G13]
MKIHTKYLNIRQYGLLLLLATLGVGCTSGGYMVSEVHSSISAQAKKMKKIVSLDPEMSYYGSAASLQEAVDQDVLRNDQFEKMLVKVAREVGIKLITRGDRHLTASDADYFNELIPLRNHILQANFSQDVNLKNGEERERIFNKAPIIDTRFSQLAQKFGTPYFSLNLLLGQGRKKKNLYLTIIVNVETAEVVYREVRFFKSKAVARNLYPVMYDSFNNIKNRSREAYWYSDES